MEKTDTQDTHLKELNEKTTFPDPMCRLVVDTIRKDRVQFKWQNQDEITHTYRPSYNTMILFSADKEFKAKMNEKLIPSYPILPMVVRTSPITALMRYQNKTPWVPCWTTSRITLWALVEMRMWFRTVYSETQLKRNDKQRITAFNNVTRRYNNTFDALDEWLTIHLKDRVYTPMVSSGVLSPTHADATGAMNVFAECLCEYTYRLIHLNEKIIQQYMLIATPSDTPFHNRPLSTLLTPREPRGGTFQWNPKDCRTAQDVASDIRNMGAWFQSKQSYAIISGIDSNGDLYTPVTHLNHSKITIQWQEGPNYANFIPYQVLWDYAMLLDGNNILGDVSKGTPCDAVEIRELKSILKHRNTLKKQRAHMGPGKFEMTK